MGETWKYVKVCVLAFVCMLFLGAGMQVQAAAPGQVTGLRQTGASDSSVSVSWNAVIGNDIWYTVELSDTPNFSSVKDETALSPEGSIHGLSAGKKYYVRVKAYYWGSSEKGAPSQTLEVVTAPDRSIKRNLRQTGAGLTSITLAWDKKGDANAYRIEYYKAGDSKSTQKINLGNVQTYTIKKLSKDTEYCFDLYPIMKNSNYTAVTTWSSDYLSYCPVLPGKVEGLKVSFSSPTTNYIDMSWDRRDSADGYQYEIYSLAGKKDKKILTGKERSKGAFFSSNKLSKAQFLKVRVRGYVSLGKSTQYGAWSKWVYTSKQPDVTARRNSKGIKLSWKKVAGANSYTVWISKNRNSGFKKVKTLSKTSITITKCGKSPLKRRTDYYCIVAANKKIGKKTYQSAKTYANWVYYTYY